MTGATSKELRLFTNELLTLRGGVPDAFQLDILAVAMRALVASYNALADETGAEQRADLNICDVGLSSRTSTTWGGETIISATEDGEMEAQGLPNPEKNGEAS